MTEHELAILDFFKLWHDVPNMNNYRCVFVALRDKYLYLKGL